MAGRMKLGLQFFTLKHGRHSVVI